MTCKPHLTFILNMKIFWFIDPSSGAISTNCTSTVSLGSAMESVNPVDVLASIHARVVSDPTERIHSRGVSLREMMRRATSAARGVSGLEARESERDDSAISIPSLAWPPDPPPPLESIRGASGKTPTLHFTIMFHPLWGTVFAVNTLSIIAVVFRTPCFNVSLY